MNQIRIAEECEIYISVSVWKDSTPKQFAHSKHAINKRLLFILKRWMYYAEDKSITFSSRCLQVL